MTFFPEVVVGHRSYSYAHNADFPVDKKWSIVNIVSVDVEHTGYERNLFFIGSGLSYHLSPAFKANALVGLKDPGAFGAINIQYSKKFEKIFFTTFLGWHYLKESDVEHFMLAQYKTPIKDNLDFVLKIQSVMTFNKHGFSRGIEQVRLGVAGRKAGFGLAVNFDQWARVLSPIYNVGFYFTYNPM